MSVIPASSTRVSSMMLSTFSLADIDNTQAQLLKVESELSSGKAVNVPSDDPAAAATIIQLQQTFNWQSTYNTNIQSATSQLGEADSTLGDLTSLLQQAQQIASQNVGSSATASQRTAASAIVQSIYNQVLAIGNKQFNGTYLFGGDGGQTAPFAQTSSGVAYQVSGNVDSTTVEPTLNTSYQVSGAKVFGSLTGVISGSTNLAPTLGATTRLMDLTGATSQCVQPGAITIGNGTTSKTIDLSTANTIGDVVSLINAAGVGTVTASITGSGLTLSGSGTENITVSDSGGTEAEQLGLATAPSGAGAGTPVTGSPLGPKITDLTPISALNNGAGIDNSGLIIGNGTTTKTITWPSTGTVQDMLNAINGAGLGGRAQINAAGTGIDVINSTQGSEMTIGENGGNTAAQLGIRSLTGATSLSSLNNGQGVAMAGAGKPDFQINLANGTNVQVTLAGAQTVQDVINAINTAGGGSVTAALATTGNGIVITDTTTGGSALSITPLNFSTAAANLGLSGAASGNKINGTDANPIESNGIFANLTSLMTALQTNDTTGINNAAAGLQTDYSRVVTINGQVGASEQQLTSVQTQLQLEQTATQSLISQLQEADIAKVSTQYQTLQTSLQASLEVTAKTSQLSLLNYLG